MRRLFTSALVVLTAAPLAGCVPFGSEDREITVVLADAAGLYVGNDVGVMGVPVGTISRIEPTGDVVEVTLEVTDDEIRIPADAAAVVVSRSVATDRYVELTPAYSSGKEMASGATIPLERTRTPVDFDRVLGSISDLAESLSAPKVANGLREVLQVTAAAFSGNSDELRGAVSGMAGLVDMVHGQSPDIFATMESLDTLTSGLVSNDELVRTFITNLGSAIELLNSERSTIADMLEGVSATADRIAKFSKDNRGSVKASLAQVQKLFQNLLASRRDLAETIEVMPLATQNVANAGAPDGHIWVRAIPTQLTPLGPLFERVCQLLGPVCNLASFPDLTGILDNLLGGGLLGGGGLPKEGN